MIIKKEGGLMAVVTPVDGPDNPREDDGGNRCSMVLASKKLRLGDKTPYGVDKFPRLVDAWKAIQRDHPDVAMAKVYILQHGSIRLSIDAFTADPEDICLLGLAYVEPDTHKMSGSQIPFEEWAREVIREELQVYEAYLNGEVYRAAVVSEESGAELDAYVTYISQRHAESVALEMLASCLGRRHAELPGLEAANA
jgi:hypothetical protein